ncbi:unnamed protein product, partial [Ixodes hexagonus]
SPQNFAIFREQPRRGEQASAATAPAPAVPAPGASTAGTSVEPCVCVRLSLPDVHLPEEKVSPSHSSYSLPSMRRRSPVVSRAKSVDARAMPFMHRLSISGRADSQDALKPAVAPLSPKLRTPSPEGASGNLLERPVSPAPPTSPRPRSLSPLLSPAYTSNSDPNPGAASPIGNIQPDLYKKKETVFFQSREARSSSCGSPSSSGGSVAPKFGRLHFRLKYDFDKSDLVVHVIEGETPISLIPPPLYRPLTNLPTDNDVFHRLKRLPVATSSKDFFFKFHTEVLPVKVWQQAKGFFVPWSQNCDLCGREETLEHVFIFCSNAEIFWAKLQSFFELDLQISWCTLKFLRLHNKRTLTDLTEIVMTWLTNVPSRAALADSYVKVSLTCGDRKVKKRKTSTKKASAQPVWNEALCFDVGSAEQLAEAHLAVAVCHQGSNAAIGACLLGLAVDPSTPQAAAHWQDMLANPRKSIAMWHSLQV